MTRRPRRQTAPSPRAPGRPAAVPVAGLSDQECRQLVSGMPCPLVCLDAHGQVVEWNAAMERWSGYSRADALGQPYVDMFVPASARALAAAEIGRLSLQPRVEAEFALLQRDGGQHEASWTFVALPQHGAAAAVVLGIGHDLARQRHLGGLQAGQSRLLELLATGAELDQVLAGLVQVIEAQSQGMLCSILGFDPNASVLLHRAAPHLPDAYNRAIHGVHIGPAVGSCGTAAHRQARVVVSDIAIDPLWAEFRELALAHGLRACWSQPILSSKGDLLGTFAMYYRQPRGPTELELELIEKAAFLAGVVLERHAAETEKLQLLAQMQQTRQLESLGMLAGGIAHDFNNLLVGILGNADLLVAELPVGSRQADDAKQIRAAGQRAADLCRRLLAYAGKGKTAIQLVDLNQLVQHVVSLVKGSIPAKVLVQYELAATLPAVEADAAQIQQVVMNLVINAADAIGAQAGRITIGTRAEVVPAARRPRQRPAAKVSPGEYAVVTVLDTGCGMDANTLARAFDPFFTTKTHGHGLGLASVRDIVHSHGGAVTADSTPGQGTLFELWLPASATTLPTSGASACDTARPWRGSGRVLLVDDEATVRTVGARMLARAGFEALLAGDGPQALELFRQHGDQIVLVMLDLNMPHTTGEEVFAALRRARADVRVLVVSGCSEDDAARRLTVDSGVTILRKPYEYDALCAALQAALV